MSGNSPKISRLPKGVRRPGWSRLTQLLRARNFDGARRHYRNFGDTAYRATHDAIDVLIQYQIRLAEDEYEKSVARYHTNLAIQLASIGGGLGLVIVFGLLIRNSITRPLARLRTAIVDTTRDHNLARRAGVDGRDEIARTAAGYDELLGTLQQLVGGIATDANVVNNSAAQVAAATTKIADDSRSQGEITAVTAAAVEQMAVSINQVAAPQARDIALKASTLSEQGKASAETAAADILAHRRLANDWHG